MPRKRSATHGGLAALALLCLGMAPALAQEAWRPKIPTAEAAPVDNEAELEQGWFPVIINPPKPVVINSSKSAEVSRPSSPTKSRPEQQESTQEQPARKLVHQSEAPSQEAAEKRPEAHPARSALAEEYCANIADAAADARFAWQKRTLSEMDAELQRRITVLEKRTAELREWLARRDAFVKKAQETLVSIYERMRPDAAASQLSAMDEETAAAVLTKIKPRLASAILNEMAPGVAARLTMTIAGAAKVNTSKDTERTGDKS